MNSIFKINDLNEKIKLVKNNKKSILISLVREQARKSFCCFSQIIA